MTVSATCAIHVVPRLRSIYRAEQYDADLGLYYLRARYYNPATGRFLSRDPEDGKPIDPKTLHKYLYAGGDPVNRIDPRGREMFEIALEDTWIETGEDWAVKALGITICGAYADLALDLIGAEGEGREILWVPLGAVCAAPFI
jgi:RHS repeat-associated protein